MEPFVAGHPVFYIWTKSVERLIAGDPSGVVKRRSEDREEVDRLSSTPGNWEKGN